MSAEQQGIWSSMARLFRVMSAHRRRHLLFVLLLMLLGAMAEIATIGAVMPFLALLADPAGSTRLPLSAAAIGSLSAYLPLGQVGAAASLFCLVALVSGLIRLQLLWSSQSFVFKLGHELAVKAQERILLQPYSFHIRTNSSSLVTAPEKVQTLVFDVLMALMHAATGLVLSVFIVAALILLDPVIAVVAALCFSGIYLGISVVTRRTLARNSATIGSAYDERAKIVQESLGGIRDVIIDGSQATFLDTFRRIDQRLNHARATTAFIGGAPRFILEALGIIVIALLAGMLARREGGLAAALPVLGAIALGAQRLLPLVQQVYHGWTNASGNRAAAVQVLDLIALPVPRPAGVDRDAAPLPLRRQIEVDRLCFTYPGRRAPAIQDIALTIPRGAMVGLIGSTGGGKSTLADLVMGLLEPTSGQVCVDGVAIGGSNCARWWRSIAHVPQAIYLADRSIAHNIAFGIAPAEIDHALVRDAAARAQLHAFIESLPAGYDTLVGERGIRLSGGQRQRVGLTRAFYKQAPLLILDEATSALDDATEAAVMDSIAAHRRGQTTLIIAHRLTTLARCDFIVRLENGRLVEVIRRDARSGFAFA